ncbi:MFS general substrate transporter [Meira miltonrushii]|uniref:MFS general substrate transporter n=1 Tax=Meira miltonrushii TaxID=1280837 RepID=A0A316VBB4_9BASI|nr:MFS general substrate transporter [Meira miltonrushii]PWN34564.1 MFS general substrate transporter [Meira miltonrushii]
MNATNLFSNTKTGTQSHHGSQDEKYGDSPRTATQDIVDELPHGYQQASTKVDPDEGFDPDFLKKTIRKIDWRLVPFLAACYSISLIDRTNISLARAAGMNAALKLNVGDRYSIAVLSFFIPYILLEFPSNIGLRKFGAAIWLSTAVTLWGLMMIAMAYVKDHHQLAALRALVGVFEAALFPGAAYLISCWYIRRQVQKRLSFFYVLSVFATGMSSILAYGLGRIYTINRSLQPWQYIFVIEGGLTVFLGLIGYVVIVDFPDKAKFLTEDQKKMTLVRIQRDRADAEHDPVTWSKVKTYIMDIKLWAFALMFMGTTTASYALSYFLPRILAGMGFSTANSQILVAPPYVWALIPAIASGIMSDKTQIRSIWIVLNCFCAIMGLALFAFLPAANTAGRYAGIFLCAGGCNSNVPLVIGWAQISIRAQSKRAYTSALTIAFGGIGGIASALVFREQDAPTYRLGIWFTIGFHIYIILACAALSFHFRKRNAQADRHGEILEGHQDFRYQL